MELKSGLSTSWRSPGTLLIAPYGIEMPVDRMQVYVRHKLLIAPYGIEMD